MASKSITLDFPEEIIAVLLEDLEFDEKLITEAKTALKGTSQEFLTSFSSAANCFIVLELLRKTVSRTSSLTVYFHCNNLLTHIIRNINDDSSPEIKELSSKLESELRRRIQNLDISEIKNLSEFGKNEPTVDPIAIKFMMEASQFPDQKSFEILLNLLDSKTEEFPVLYEELFTTLLSIQTIGLTIPKAKQNFLMLIKYFLEIDPIPLSNGEILKTAFLNFISDLNLENEQTETFGLIQLFDLSVNKIFTEKFPLPSQCIQIIARYPEFSLSPSFVEYCKKFLTTPVPSDESYVISLLQILATKIADEPKKVQIYGGNLGPLLLNIIIDSNFFSKIAPEVIPVFKSGSGFFKIGAEATKAFEEGYKKGTSKFALDTIAELCSEPKNFEDGQSFASFVQVVGNGFNRLNFMDPSGRLPFFSSTCNAMAAVVKAGFEFEERVINYFCNITKIAGKEQVFSQDEKSLFINLMLQILILQAKTANYNIWQGFLRDEENLDENGYLCEAILRNVDVNVDERTWAYFLYETSSKRRNQIFNSFAALAAKGKFPRNKIVETVQNLASRIFVKIKDPDIIFNEDVEHRPERVLSLLRAWIKNEENKNIEPEVLEIFSFAPELNSCCSETSLFEIHQNLLERGENGNFRIDQEYKNVLAGYINMCVIFPPKDRMDMKPLHYGVGLICKYDLENGLISGFRRNEVLPMTKSLKEHVDAGNKQEDEKGEDMVIKARDKVAKYLETVPDFTPIPY